MLVCDIDAAMAQRVADGTAAAGRTVHAAAIDVTDRASVAAALGTAVTTLGGVDVLVANAGILRQAHVVDLEPADWAAVLAVNLTGVFNCCQIFARAMVEAGRGGRIIITSSIAGLMGDEFFGAYAASKFGVIGLAESLAVELAAHDILVNCVCPGVVDTQMMEQLASEQAAALELSVERIARMNREGVALGRYGTPQEIADAYVYLASPLSRYVTGQRIVVDGGIVGT